MNKIFTDDFNVLLYLDVPYSEKDEAKSLGARFNANIKKWYYHGSSQKLSFFSKWILRNRTETIITDNVYIISNKHTCWKCKRDTTVMAFGIGDYISLWRDGEIIDSETNVNKQHNSIHIAWTDKEQNIPPLLLKYIKRNYNVKTGYSRVVGKCFANHCEFCGTIQGNYHLFQENGPFYLWAATDEEAEKKFTHIELHWVPCDCSLQLDWDVYETPFDNDYEYIDYDEINLIGEHIDPDYKDLYELE